MRALLLYCRYNQRMKEKLQEFAVSMSMISQIYFHVLNQERQKLNSLPIWRRLFAQYTSKQRIFMKALAEMTDLDIGQIAQDALGYPSPQFQMPNKRTGTLNRTGNRKSLTPSVAAAVSSNPTDKQNPSAVASAASTSGQLAVSAVVSTNVTGNQNSSIPSAASSVAVSSASATSGDCPVSSGDGSAEKEAQKAAASSAHLEIRSRNTVARSQILSQLISAQRSGPDVIDVSKSKSSEKIDLRLKTADKNKIMDTFELHEVVIHKGTFLPKASEHQRRSINRLASNELSAPSTSAHTSSAVVIDPPNPVTEHLYKSNFETGISQVDPQISFFKTLQETNDRPSTKCTNDRHQDSGNLFKSSDYLSTNRGRAAVDVKRPILTHPTRLVQAKPILLSKLKPLTPNRSPNSDPDESQPSDDMHDEQSPHEPSSVMRSDSSRFIGQFRSPHFSSTAPQSASEVISSVNVGQNQSTRQVSVLQANDVKSAALHQQGKEQHVLKPETSSRSALSSTSAAARSKRQNLATVSAYVDGPASSLATLERKMHQAHISPDTFLEYSSAVPVAEKDRQKYALGASEFELGILSKPSESKLTRQTAQQHRGSSAVATPSGAPLPLDMDRLKVANRRDQAAAAAQDALNNQVLLANLGASAASLSQRSNAQQRRGSSAVTASSGAPLPLDLDRLKVPKSAS
jgi:hypothetical protein